MLAVFLVAFDIYPSVHYAALPIVLLVEVVVIFAVMLPLSAIVPLFPDIALLANHVIRLMFYLSAVFYPIDMLPEDYQHFLYYNPMVVIIESCREILIEHQWPTLTTHLTVITLIGIAMILAATLLMKRLDSLYAKRIYK